jgi:hypothetical protein
MSSFFVPPIHGIAFCWNSWRDTDQRGLEARDVRGRKLILKEPKSGKQTEVVFIPHKTADRLRGFIENQEIQPEQRIFHMTYRNTTFGV